MKKNKTVDDWYYSFMMICLVGLMAILIQAYKTEGKFFGSKGKTGKYCKDKSKTFLSVRVNPRFV